MKWTCARGAATIVGVFLASAPQIAWSAVFNVPPDLMPATLGAGDILNVSASVPFAGTTAGVGSQVNILAGGSIGFGFTSSGAVHIFPGGGLGSWTLNGGTLEANGGANGPLTMRNGAYANIDGGGMVGGINSQDSTIDFRAGQLFGSLFLNSTLNAYGGDYGSSEFFMGNSRFNLFGGTFTDSVGPRLSMGGELHLYVQNVLVGGSPIPSLVPGGTATVAARNVAYTGMLADGSAFNMTLYNEPGPNRRYVITLSGTVKVTLVPEPSALALAVLGLMTATAARGGGRYAT